jgi:hypothetical protein
MGHFFKFSEDSPAEKHEFHFSIINHKEMNGNLAVRIRYKNCKNYDGEKILVIRGMTMEAFISYTKYNYDPHFLWNNNELIARFRPTEEGWLLAIKMLNFII